jgi:hypothetical protein
MAADSLGEDSIVAEAELVGRYTLSPLAASQVVTASQLAPLSQPELVNGSVVVAVPARSADALGGRLAPGSVVQLWLLNDSAGPRLLVERVLALGAQRVETGAESAGRELPYVVVLAVPEAQQAAIIGAAATGSLALTPAR